MNNIRVNLHLGCHASYNDGFLFDKSYTVEDSIDLDSATEDFEKHVIESIKKARPDWIADGYITDTYAEELYLADYEVYIDDEFQKIDFGESIYDLKNFLDEACNIENLPLVMAIAENQSCEITEVGLDDRFYFEVDSDSHYDLGYAYAETTDLLMDVSDILVNYFDYEAYGRDLSYEMTVYNINGTYYAVSNN